MEWMIIVSIALNLFLAGATVATLFWKRECDRLLDELEKRGTRMNERRKVVHAVIRDDANRILLLKRVPNEIDTEGLWDLPGGSVEEGEHPVDALVREIHEEVGIPGAITGWICRFDWPHYSNPQVTLDCDHYQARLLATLEEHRIQLSLTEHTQARWVTRAELEEYALLNVLMHAENRISIFGPLGGAPHDDVE